MSTSRLSGLRLFIADLALRQFEIERGLVPLQPVGYRVLAKRMRSALAGQPAPKLRYGFKELAPHLQPLVHEALETRHFDEHGTLGPGAQAARVAELAHALLARVSAGTRRAA